METLHKLEAVEAIKQLKARYFRFVDTKQWDDLKDLFAEDAAFDGLSSGMGEVSGRDDFVAKARAGLTDCVSVHHGHCPEIEVISETAARGIWAMEDRLLWSEESSSPVRSLHGMGHYHEHYRKIEGAWKISAWRLTRLRVDVDSA